MSMFKKLFTAAASFLGSLKNKKTAEAETVRTVVMLPRVRAVRPYPQPNFRKSGVAAAKRAARKARNRRKAK